MGEGGVDVSFQMQSILYDTVVAVDFSYFIFCVLLVFLCLKYLYRERKRYVLLLYVQ